MREKRQLQWGTMLVLSAFAILVFYDTFFQNGVLLTFFRKLSEILQPVIFGAVFAYLLFPVVAFFERRIGRGKLAEKPNLLRGLSITCCWLSVALFLFVFFLLVLPQLYSSVQHLVANLSSYYATILGWANQLKEFNPDLYAKVAEFAGNYYNNLSKLIEEDWLPKAQVALVAVTGGLWSVVSFFFDLLVGVCVSVYLLAKKEAFGRSSRKLLYSFVNESRYERTLRAFSTANDIFSGYVRGQLLDALIIGGVCFLFCTVFSLPYAPLVSVIVGVTNIIPFFGPFLGAIPSAFLILLVEPIKCLYFIIFIFVLQQCDGNILKPRIFGRSMGLSGFWIIFSILVGGGFFGPLGMFLSVPVFACLHTAIHSLSDAALKKKGVENVAPTLNDLTNAAEKTADE